MKINCSKAVNFFKEYKRMCDSYTACCNCDLYKIKNMKAWELDCREFISQYTEKTIEIVQKWSDEHPEKTYEDKLKEVLPNSDLILIKNHFTPYAFFGEIGLNKSWKDKYIESEIESEVTGNESND